MVNHLTPVAFITVVGLGRAAPAHVQVRRARHLSGSGRRGRGAAARYGPLLVGPGEAVPDLQGCAVGRARSRGVQAFAEGAQRAVGAGGPGLRGAAVAVVDLHLRAVGTTGGADVEALAEGADGSVGADGPLLGGGAVAGVELDLGAVRAARSGDVGALAAVAGDLAGGGEGGGDAGQDEGERCHQGAQERADAGGAGTFRIHGGCLFLGGSWLEPSIGGSATRVMLGNALPRAGWAAPALRKVSFLFHAPNSTLVNHQESRGVLPGNAQAASAHFWLAAPVQVQICSGVPSAELGPVASRHLPSGVDSVPSAPMRPGLRGGAVAVVELHLRAVGGTGGVDVQALAQRPDGAVGADGPLLRGGAVAGVELDLRTVGAARAGDVDALAAVAGDRPCRSRAAAGLRRPTR